jgi:formate/nitrite transporter FocA (FNT family)
VAASREPEEIYEETRKEGRRRLSRPVLELAATALVGGFDVAFGVAVYGLAAGAVGGTRGRIAGAIAFGISFVFIVVGKSELFTENFLIPIAGLNPRNRGSWLKLGELWAVALVVNILGGLLIVILMTTHGVLRSDATAPLRELARHITGYATLTSFVSAIIAGALMTLMTWFVEGAAMSLGVRIVMAWIVGAVIVLGGFNHAIVSTIELLYGLRLGGHVAYHQLFSNLGLAVGGNLVGGLLLVTFVRAVQAVGGSRD